MAAKDYADPKYVESLLVETKKEVRKCRGTIGSGLQLAGL